MKQYITTIIIATMSVGSIVQAESFMPILDVNKEWGYVKYGPDPVHNVKDIPEFYRVATSLPQTIDGASYFPTGACHRLVFANIHVMVYMREQDGKVYARYNEQAYTDDDNYYKPGKEYLLYDFNMKPGESLSLEPRAAGEECIVLKCIETGQVETEDGKRRYLKFDTNINETTRKWMAYEYLVEGIGPVGDCNVMIPYRLHYQQTEKTSLTQNELLYKRIKGENSAEFRGQGEMVYTSPAFDLWGIHDPSVWCTPSKPSSFGSVENTAMPALPDNSITMTQSEKGGHCIVSSGEELTEVTVFDMIGRTLASYNPQSHEFLLYTSQLDASVVIIRAATAKGSRSFKIALR